MTTPVSETAISAQAGMDAVTLRVGDLELMTGYYADALALEPLEEAARGREVHRVLGRAGTPMVKFVSTLDLPAGSRRQAGLFHTAFLFETEESLAATVAHAAANTNSRFLASQDHLVSQAFYFSDPEGNGIELYVDRARSQWGRTPDGEIAMDSIAFDPDASSPGISSQAPSITPHSCPASSAMSTSRSATSTGPGISTSALSASRRRTRRCAGRSSPPPAATTTTWR